MKRTLTLLLLPLWLETIALDAAPLFETVTVHPTTTGNRPNHRIPALIMAPNGDGTIGLVYERGPKGGTHYWDEIQFARFNLEWMLAPPHTPLRPVSTESTTSSGQ